MNKRNHQTIHSLVPVYASLSRIQKLAVDGFRSGKIDVFIDIRTEAEDGLAQLIMVEKELVNGRHKVSSMRSKGTRRGTGIDSKGVEGVVIGCTGAEERGRIVQL